MRDLLRDVRVAADEYVAGAAGGLTLGELGHAARPPCRRADRAVERVGHASGPILLEAS